MCNCKELIKQSIKKSYNSTSVIFKLCNIHSIGNGNSSIKKTAQEISIITEYTTKKGIKKTKTRNSFVAHNNCPWCGYKYEDEITPSV